MTIPNGVKGYELHLKERELASKENELNLKRYEAENTAYEMRNTFLRDVSSRVDSLVKSILLINGGALTVSIGNFLRPDHPILSGNNFFDLKIAWISLFLSMALSVLVVFVMIVSGDLHGKRWGEFLRKKEGELQQPKYIPWLAWTMGTASVIFCCSGLGLLATVAVNVLH